MYDLTSIWNEVLEIIRPDVSPVGFDTWIKSINPLSIENDEIILEVPNEFYKNMIESRYSPLIKTALTYITNKSYNISIIEEDEKEEIKVKTPSVSAPANRNTLNPNYTFEKFVIGNSNKFAHAASLAVAEDPGDIKYNPLFLYGGVGLGKTHLMQAVGNHILMNFPEKSIKYVTGEQFTNELVNALKDSKMEEFKNKYRSIDVLMIDDIQFIAGKEKSEEEFFHTFEALHQNNKQIILTSDRPPKELYSFNERTKTRFEWGVMADLSAPEFETRLAIIHKKMDMEGYFIDDNVAEYIAKTITSNIRELEGAIKKIIAYQDLMKEDITLETAEKIIIDFNISKSKTITPDACIKAVEKHFNLKDGDLVSQKKTKDISYPRQMCMYIMRELTKQSLPKIGQALGGRDHTTVLHGIKKIENDIDDNSTIKNIVEDIMKNIKNQ